jgi:hypothetical protein
VLPDGAVATGETAMSPEISALAALSWIARGKVVARKHGYDEALSLLTANRVPERIKAAIGAGSTLDSTLGPEGTVIGDFSNTMRMASAFYRMLSDNAFARVPLYTRAGMITSVPSAGVVAEGVAVPVTKITLNNVILAPIKCAALLVCTSELLLNTSAAGQACFSRELQSVVAAAVDTAFVDIADNGVTPITSTGPTKDLRAALLATNAAGIARPYWIAAVDVAKFASTLGTNLPAFAAASAVGGELANLPMLVSSGVASGTLYLIDASGFAADGGPVAIEVSSEADILMNTAPPMNSTTPTAASMVNMFQTDSAALKAVAMIGASKIRNDAAALITGITTTTWAA